MAFSDQDPSKPVTASRQRLKSFGQAWTRPRRHRTKHRNDLQFPSKRMLVEWWVVLVTATLGMILVGFMSPPVRLDNFIYDSLLRERPIDPQSDVMVVKIDNHSLQELGSWPWSRATHARLIDELTKAGVAAIGYQVNMNDPQSAEVDQLLADAMTRNGRVVLSNRIEIPGPNGLPAHHAFPVEPMLSAAAAVGHVMMRPDIDGILRGVVQLKQTNGQRNYHLAESLVAQYLGQADILQAPRPQPYDGVFTGRKDLIPYLGQGASISQLSFVDVVSGEVPPGLLAGKLVLVGVTSNIMGDRFSTPMAINQETMPSVEVTAHYVNSLIQQNIMHTASTELTLTYSLVPVWILMLGLLFLGPSRNLWLGLGLGAVMLAGSYFAMGYWGVWISPAIGLCAIALIFPLWGWRRLDLATRYLVAELRDLDSEERVLPRLEKPMAGDQVERQIMLMHQAIRDVRDLRLFVAQSLDSLPDAAVVADMEGHVQIANDAADSLFGPRLDGIITARPLEDLFRSLDADPSMPDPRAQDLLEQMGRVDLASADDVPDIGYETQLADGTCLEIRLAYFTDAERRPLGWIARFADLTALRASERQREDALRLLTHDMRAPQAAILAVLKSEAKRVPPEVARRLERYAYQTISLADDFVHLARAEHGRFMLETFNLSDALLDACDDLWPLAGQKQILIDSDIPEDEALVHADRALLTRAITNLLGNALKYSSNGTNVHTRVRLEGCQVICEIQDNGRGIAAEDLPHLFDAFVRTSAPEGAEASATASGAGLGLAFVKAVIERHKGKIEVESRLGVGSVFRFTLPRTRG